MPDRPLTEIRGVGPATAHELAQHGYTTVGKLASARPGALTVVSGFGLARAAAVRAAARELLAVVPTSADGPAAERAVEVPVKPEKGKKASKKKAKKGKAGKGGGDKEPKKTKKAKKGKTAGKAKQKGAGKGAKKGKKSGGGGKKAKKAGKKGK